MLRKFKTVLSTTILVATTMVCSTALAEINPKLTIDEENKKVTISGALENVNGNTDITLTVVKRYDGKGLESIKIYNLSDKQRNSLYMREIQSSDGSFAFEFTPRGGSGSYDYYINYSNNETAYKNNFTFVDLTEQAQCLDVINNGTVDEIISKINDNIDGSFSGISLNFNSITDSEKKRDVIETIVTQSDFTEFSDAIAEINRLSIITKFIENADINEVLNNAQTAGIKALGSYNDILEKETEFINEVTERLSNVKLTDNFNELFSRAVYLTMIHNAKNSTQIGGIIDKIDKNTDLTVDKYLALNDTTDIDSKIVGNYYTSVELESLIKNYQKPLSGGSAGVGGMSGGRGSSSASGAYASGGISAVTSIPSSNSVTENQSAVSFYDVPKEHWAYSSIEVLCKKGIIMGNENGDYEPERNISRKEFVKIAVSTFELENVEAACSFTDVDKNDWSYKYIATAYSYGVISGKSSEVFAPDDSITREEAAHILYNIISLENYVIPKISEINAFSDLNDISEYAKGSILSFCAGGIINGYADNTLAPKNYITRAECAQLIVNLLKNIR